MPSPACRNTMLAAGPEDWLLRFVIQKTVPVSYFRNSKSFNSAKPKIAVGKDFCRRRAGQY